MERTECLELGVAWGLETHMFTIRCGIQRSTGIDSNSRSQCFSPILRISILLSQYTHTLRVPQPTQWARHYHWYILHPLIHHQPQHCPHREKSRWRNRSSTLRVKISPLPIHNLVPGMIRDRMTCVNFANIRGKHCSLICSLIFSAQIWTFLLFMVLIIGVQMSIVPVPIVLSRFKRKKIFLHCGAGVITSSAMTGCWICTHATRSIVGEVDRGTTFANISPGIRVGEGSRIIVTRRLFYCFDSIPVSVKLYLSAPNQASVLRGSQGSFSAPIIESCNDYTIPLLCITLQLLAAFP